MGNGWGVRILPTLPYTGYRSTSIPATGLPVYRIPVYPSPDPARVKRWCKRPPASGVTRAARQPPPGARPSRGDVGATLAVAPHPGNPCGCPSSGQPLRLPLHGAARPVRAPGGPHEAAGNRRPREMTAHDRTRLIGRPGAHQMDNHSEHKPPSLSSMIRFWIER